MHASFFATDPFCDVPDSQAANFAHHSEILAALDRAASDHSAIALARLVRHPSGIVPVVGSAKPIFVR